MSHDLGNTANTREKGVKIGKVIGMRMRSECSACTGECECVPWRDVSDLASCRSIPTTELVAARSYFTLQHYRSTSLQQYTTAAEP